MFPSVWLVPGSLMLIFSIFWNDPICDASELTINQFSFRLPEPLANFMGLDDLVIYPRCFFSFLCASKIPVIGLPIGICCSLNVVITWRRIESHHTTNRLGGNVTCVLFVSKGCFFNVCCGLECARVYQKLMIHTPFMKLEVVLELVKRSRSCTEVGSSAELVNWSEETWI